MGAHSRVDPFGILFICTGNIHRSVAAERLLMARLAPSAQVSVNSAGMRAVVGHPTADHTATVLGELNADPSGHSARQFVPQLALEADLILTAERQHANRILEDCPSVMRRMFPLREFARLAGLVDPLHVADPDDMSAQVLAISGLRIGEAPQDDDIPDPVWRDLAGTRTLVHELARDIDAVVRALGLLPA